MTPPPARPTATLPLTLSAEAADARAHGRPVVALESTILAHGLPWPRNLEVARQAEAVIRDQGAVPATIAVLDGRLHTGLDAPSLERLARSAAPGAEPLRKLSRADLAHALAAGTSGATTVAATMIGARAAGIEVFATGGIGGVHRGASDSWDVSADLHELARTPVTVVAAGAKAILDLPKTLEVLETLGVPVLGWRTHAFPAFWSRDSGLAAPLRVETAAEAARAHRLRAALGLEGGQLLAVPIPAEAEIPPAALAPAIAAALSEAEAQGLTGKPVTPFLLSKVLEATQGASLEANIALVLNNARVAAQVACALAAD